MPTTVSVIGLGAMGGALARNLLRFDGSADSEPGIVVYDPNPQAMAALVEQGARSAPSAAAAAERSAVVVTCLPTPAVVLRVVAEIADVLAPTAVVVDTSTIDPTTARRARGQLGADRYLACLLGKGPAQAETGDIPLFLGGDPTAIERADAVLDRLGSSRHLLGSVEAATTFKLVSNLVGMTNLAVLAEGMTLCRRAGVGDAAFTAALAETGAWSYQADVRLSWMQDRDLDARFSVALAVKDLALALDLGTDAGLSTPVGRAGLEQLRAAVELGHGGSDVAAVIEVVDPRGAS